MKKILEKWKRGCHYLIEDDLISYYTFFTVILAECSYLWTFYEAEIAVPFTLILLGYIINVLGTAWLKGIVEGSVFSAIVSIIYIIVFIVLLILSCSYDMILGIVLNLILFVVTAITIGIRTFQDSIFYSSNWFISKMQKLFSNESFWLMSQILLIGVPYVVFVIMFAQITYVPIVLKIIVPIVYLIIIPFISKLEDDLCACNIFELAIEWD